MFAGQHEQEWETLAHAAYPLTRQLFASMRHASRLTKTFEFGLGPSLEVRYFTGDEPTDCRKMKVVALNKIA